MKNVLIIGLGRFGIHIAMQLNQLGHEVMAVDWKEERVDKVLSFVTNAQIGDSTNAEFLQSLGIGNYDICFVTIGDSFQNSLETTSLLKELGAKLVISRAERDVQEKFLLRNGADKVVYPEKQVAKWAPSVIQMIISWIIWRWTLPMQFLKWKCRKNGLEKQWADLTSENATILISWQ